MKLTVSFLLLKYRSSLWSRYPIEATDCLTSKTNCRTYDNESGAAALLYYNIFNISRRFLPLTKQTEGFGFETFTAVESISSAQTIRPSPERSRNRCIFQQYYECFSCRSREIFCQALWSLAFRFRIPAFPGNNFPP